MESSLFNFSRRATKDADRMEIQKYYLRTDLRTDRQTWVGARDACASKKEALLTEMQSNYFCGYLGWVLQTVNQKHSWWWDQQACAETVDKAAYFDSFGQNADLCIIEGLQVAMKMLGLTQALGVDPHLESLLCSTSLFLFSLLSPFSHSQADSAG